MRLGPKTGCGYAQRGQWQHFVKHGVPSEHRKTAWLGSARKRLVECGDLGIAQLQISGACIVRGVFRTRRLWNRKHRWRTREKRQRDLARGGLVRVGDGLQHLAALTA